jgi:hypothetical protein
MKSQYLWHGERGRPNGRWWKATWGIIREGERFRAQLALMSLLRRRRDTLAGLSPRTYGYSDFSKPEEA